MSACDPMEGGWDEKLKHVGNTADGVRDIARGTAIDGALLAEKNWWTTSSTRQQLTSRPWWHGWEIGSRNDMGVRRGHHS